MLQLLQQTHFNCMKYAILFHLLQWECNQREFILDKGLTFIDLKAHPVGTLYKKICETENVDNGDPFGSNFSLQSFVHEILPLPNKLI